MDRRTGIRNKRGRCEIRYSVRGAAYTEVLPIPYTEAGLVDAAKIRQQRIDFYKHGIGEKETGEVPTFATLAQSWLDTAELTPSSRRTSKSRINTHWMPYIGHLPVDKIRYAHLREVIAQKAELSPKTRRNILADLKAIMGLALESDYIQTNPATQFGKIKGQSKEIEPFTREERDAILGKLEGAFLLFYAIRFYCGLRPGEVLALEWADYDGQSLNVSKQVVDGKARSATKTERARSVVVHSYVQKLLREYPTRFKKGAILVNQYGKPYRTYHRFGDKFNEVREELEIPYRTPYNVRHTAATMWLRATRDPVWVAEQLGNSVEMIFRQYAGVIYEDRDKEMRQLVEDYL